MLELVLVVDPTQPDHHEQDSTTLCLTSQLRAGVVRHSLQATSNPEALPND